MLKRDFNFYRDYSINFFNKIINEYIRFFYKKINKKLRKSMHTYFCVNRK